MNLYTLKEEDCIDSLPIASGSVVKVLRVLDGDTIKIGFYRDGVGQKISVRCLGYDAPETHSTDAVEKAFALQSKEKLQTLIEGKLITLKTVTPDKYGGRVLADFSCDGTPSACEYMLQFPNLARSYHGEKKPDWVFTNASTNESKMAMSTQIITATNSPTGIQSWPKKLLCKLFPGKIAV